MTFSFYTFACSTARFIERRRRTHGKRQAVLAILWVYVRSQPRRLPTRPQPWAKLITVLIQKLAPVPPPNFHRMEIVSPSSSPLAKFSSFLFIESSHVRWKLLLSHLSNEREHRSKEFLQYECQYADTFLRVQRNKTTHRTNSDVSCPFLVALRRNKISKRLFQVTFCIKDEFQI